ncbi:tripartite tricarboxylate transporter permease [Azospira restricta]|uniref:Tripartite tricarboxylate transporter permease n=1 Tax=Azospira restricta TaxID=404405 RepID=A0A974SN95_9RHOO|nr:tripartite tricarboxylate transporter permease [Azospira restricta]QRJ63277.1 tripartite tricarboxylate transporter permease [Azospira restricta]
METFNHLFQGFAVAGTPTNLMIALAGCFLGTVIGLLPGLGPINGVAILLPIAFAMNLPPESALILLCAVYAGCEYGGRISAILINVPGDAGAVMTTMDGFPMARKGLAGPALSISAWSSFVGSMLATIGIVFFAPILSEWAIAFGPAEYFALMVLALSCLGGLVGDSLPKAAVACLLGLLMSCVGIDSNSGVYRFTFDILHLSDGIPFVVIVIGLFAVSELMLMLESHQAGAKPIALTGRMMFNFREWRLQNWATFRSSVVGFFIGVLPGAGATVASAMTYSMERRMAGKDHCFGDGDVRGVAAPEAANNASAYGSLIPMLTLGVPGSGTTAVMIGALTLYNINPGPTLFQDQPLIVWGLIASLFIANIMLLVMNIPMIRLFVKFLDMPNWLLVPLVAAVSLVGVYSVHSTSFDLVFGVLLGGIGYLLRVMNFPISPLILGFVLGDMMEQNLRRALSISNGELSVLFASPISIVLWVGAAAMLIGPRVFRALEERKLRNLGLLAAEDAHVEAG